jgi:hypothetical protein
VILGIFRKIAVRARFRDRLDDPRALFGLQTMQFLFELFVALDRNRNPFHRHR